jgi:hypothetical protein
MANVIRILERNKYLLDDETTLIVPATDFKHDIFDYLGVLKYEKSGSTIAERSDANKLTDMKATAKIVAKESCCCCILDNYSIQTQIEINELKNGYDATDKTNMWTTIDSKNSWYNSKETEIDNCTTITALKAVDLVCT